MLTPSWHQESSGRSMDVYMKSGLHIDVHWTSKGLLMPTGIKYQAKTCKSYVRDTEKNICLKKVFSEKPILAFRKMKSIRNYIVRTVIKEADDQKKPKITTPCYSCRKTCHPIISDETLKNIHNKNEIKTLAGLNCRTANIVYAASCKIHGDIYIGDTAEELRERFSKHRYGAKNRPDNNELVALIHKLQHEFDKYIEV